MKTLQTILEDFEEKFNCVFNVGVVSDSITKENIKSFITTSLQELLEQVVPEEKRNLITKKRRLTYSDVDDAYNLCCQKVEERIKNILNN